MENKKLIQLLVSVTGAVTVLQIQVPRYKIKAVRVSTENEVKSSHTHKYSSNKLKKGDKSHPKAHWPSTLHV
jgi:hypothetical protein